MEGLLKEEDFQKVLDYIMTSTGIILPDTNYRVLHTFLNERLTQTGQTITEYLQTVKVSREEHILFIDTITINETYFFREEKHFQVLKSTVFPELARTKQKPLSIWSSACSSGEEAISLYVLASECLGPPGAFSLLATDINESVLEKFRAGCYGKNSFRTDGTVFHPLIRKAAREENNMVYINNRILSDITIQTANLSALPREVQRRKFDIIFLRNTIIYFEIDQRPAIMDGIVELLSDDGYLFLSSTEMPLISHPQLELVPFEFCFLFRKKNAAKKGEGQVVTAPLFNTIIEGQEQNSGSFLAVSPGSKQVSYNRRTPERRNTYNPEQILTFAGQKLNNQLFELPHNADYQASLLIVEIIYFFNSHKPEQARKLLDRYREDTGENELYSYLTGFLAMIGENFPEAVNAFDRCLLENPVFWPARYYRAKAQLEIGKDKSALRDFTLCKGHITKYIENSLYHYQILLDGFNGKYFFSMCSKWITKLEEQGHSYGVR